MFTKIFIFVACATVFVVESKPLEQLGPLKTCAVENGITLETDSLIGTPDLAELAVICILRKENATVTTEDDFVIFDTLLVLLRDSEAEEDGASEDVVSSNEDAIAEEEPELGSSSSEASKSISKRAAKPSTNAKGTARKCYFNAVSCF